MSKRIELLPVPAVLCALAMAACSRESGVSRSGKNLEFPVEVTTVSRTKATFVIQTVGAVEAFERIEITARVAGTVEAVNFIEGQAVRAGDSLAEIDVQRYKYALDSATAAWHKADAVRTDAENALQRREDMAKTDVSSLSIEELSTWRTRARSAAAEAAEARAAAGIAELNLRDAYVRAPATGIVQTRTVQTGQYVQPGMKVASLVRREPLLVRFSVSEVEAGLLKRDALATFQTGDSAASYEAQIIHIGDEADAGTRLVPVVARVTDRRKADIRPGAFANVSIEVPVAEPRPVIPETAVRPTSRGFLAYIVREGKAVEKTVELGGRTARGEIEARSGIEIGDVVVVRGADALRDGSAVKIAGSSAFDAVDKGGQDDDAKTSGGKDAKPVEGKRPL